MLLPRGFALTCAILGLTLTLLSWLWTDTFRSVAFGAGAAFLTAAGLALACRRSSEKSFAAENKHALATAAIHAAHVQAILDTATEGIITIDERGSIQSFNGAAERLFGYQAREVRGENVKLLMPDPYAVEHDDYLTRYLSTGERRIIGLGREVLGRRNDGSQFPIDLSVGEGWIEGRRFFTAVIRDITERHEMQAKLTQAERLAAVGELAAGVAHEVNNPINTMINCAQLISDGDDPVENGKIIMEEGQRIAEIVQALLQFARDDRDSPQSTSLNDVVERTLRLFGENLKRHGIAVRVDVPERMPDVLARPQQIQQVLLNLLINAKDILRTLTTHRQVVVGGGHDLTSAFLTVHDNGPGIPAHLGHRIFEPFVTTKRAHGGTGLGLSISKSIIEGYNGSIAVESSPQTGTTFRISLPLANHTD